jgi:4-aminobutyrate aminotransferase-like enzyme
MDFAIFDSPRPDVRADTAVWIARDVYGLDGNAEPLQGERDRSFKITTDTDAYVLKVGNPADLPEALEGQAGAMEHAVAADPLLPIPAVVRSRDGSLSPRHQGHSVQLVRFVEGVSPPTDVPAGLRRSVGSLAGRVSRALRGYDHPALHRVFPWDLQQMKGLEPLIQEVSPERRPLVEWVFARFEGGVVAKLAGLPKQAVHGDINPDNFVVAPNDPERIVGLFDFGDMAWGPAILELAVAAAYQGFGSDPVVAMAQVAAAFHVLEPLVPEEMDLLPDLVAARAAQSLLMAVRHAALHSDNAEYLSGDSDDMARTLRRLVDTDPEEAAARVRRACGVRADRRADFEAAKKLRHDRLGPALELSYDTPVRLDRGEGVWLIEDGGHRLLDAYNNVPHVGHAHPQVVAALSAQARLLSTNTRYLVDEVAEYADRLAALLPNPLDVVMFVNSGSEANDLAYQIAGVVTGKRGLITTAHAYHGTTFATAAMSPEEFQDSGWTPPAERVGGANLLRSDDPGGTVRDQLADAARRLGSRGEGAGMVIFDTVFSSEGIYGLPAGLLGAAREWSDANGALLVADEVQAGFGRTGASFWGFGVDGTIPDIVTLGKPMGNGYPMGAVVTTAEIAAEFASRWHFFSTFAGSPLAAAVGSAVLDVIEDEGLPANADLVGYYLRDRIESWGHPSVVEVRGPGLFGGVELNDADTAASVVNEMRRRSVLIGSTGPESNVLKIRPPLVFTECHADIVVQTFRASLSEI